MSYRHSDVAQYVERKQQQQQRLLPWKAIFMDMTLLIMTRVMQGTITQVLQFFNAFGLPTLGVQL